MKLKYQVGELTNPQPKDPEFNDLESARDHANKEACVDCKRPIAIWDERYDVVALFVEGQEFKPA